MLDEGIHAVLYDLSSAMGGESQTDPLITKVLQRLLFHTGHRTGAYLALMHGAGTGEGERYHVHTVVGDPAMLAGIGGELRLPAAIAEQGGQGHELSGLLPEGLDHAHAAWIPVPGEGLLLLCSGTPIDGEALPIPMLRPAMLDFVRALQHCRTSETLVADLKNRYRDSNQSLVSERKRFLKLLASMPDAIILTDGHGLMLTVNRHTETLFGYASEALVDNPVEMLIPRFGQLLQAIHAAPATALNETKRTGIGRRLTVRRQNGEFFPVSISISPFILEGREELMVSIRDMTEYENLANQFQQAQKMEALGTLVSGVSHDFNNLLTTIAANAHMAKRQVARDQAAATERLREIERQCASAQEMIGELLAFSRKEGPRNRAFSFTALMRDSLKLYATAIPKEIDLDVDLADEPLTISGSPSQIQQVVLNLLNNARDAMAQAPEKRIGIELRPLAVDPLMRHKNPMFTAGRYAQLTLTDTGQGIPHHIIKKIFEPFFTTKPAGRGTGLGLSMVYGTIEAHQGIIEVESQEGKGTRFRIFLPLV